MDATIVILMDRTMIILLLVLIIVLIIALVLALLYASIVCEYIELEDDMQWDK